MLERSQPGVALLRGEAGIGKSAIVREFADVARARGFPVLQGACCHVKEAGPYFPLRQLLVQSAGYPGPVNERLESVAVKTKTAGGASPRELRGRMAAAVSEALLSDTAGRPTLLIIEDLHWADLGTLVTVSYLVDVRRPDLHLVFSLRDGEELDEDEHELVHQIAQKSTTLRVRGLSPEDAGELLASLAPHLPLAKQEVEELTALTNGNPLLLRELFLHLRESGLLEKHSLTEAARRTRTPADLGHVIDSRLRRLPPHVLATLKDCAVLGASFSPKSIAAVAGVTATEVGEDLEHALKLGLLIDQDFVGGAHYRFAHSLFAARLYDSMGTEERQHLHRKVLSCTDLPAEDLARHYALGFGEEAGTEGIELCRQAAERAERVAAYEVAARYWELAIRCTPSSDKGNRAPLFRRLGDAAHAAGKWTQAVEAWTESACLFGLEADPVSEGAAALALGELHRWRQEPPESERWLTRAVELLPAGSSQWARALALLGSIRCLLQDHASGLRLLEDAVAKVEEAEARDPIAGYWLAYGFITSGDSERAYGVAQRAFEDAERERSLTGRLLLARSLLAHELARLHPDAAEQYLRVVEQTADKADPMSAFRLLVARAYLAGYRGEWRRVADLCQGEMGGLRLLGPYVLASVRSIWAEAQLALGHPDVARDALGRSLGELKEMRPVAAMYLARACLHANDGEGALSLLKEFGEATMARRTLAAHAILGEVASHLLVPEMWAQCHARLACEQLPLVMVYGPVSVDRVQGRLAGRLKDWSAAFQHFELALNRLEAGEARGELVKTFLDYAEFRRARGRRGDVGRAEALELRAYAILDQLGIGLPANVRIHSTSANPFGLTARELEVVSLLAEGKRNDQIAECLTLSIGTVERHLANIYCKMGVANRTEAISVAMREGLLAAREQPPTTSPDGSRPPAGRLAP